MTAILVACLALFLVTANVASAGHHGEKKDKKVGILLVAFGSSEDSAQVSFENIDKKVKATYPEYSGKMGLYLPHYQEEAGWPG